MRTFALSLAGLALAGCLGQHKYQPQSLYDLQTRYAQAGRDQTPQAAAGSVLLAVEPFRILAPARVPMLGRIGPQELEEDDYNRWVQAPEKCVERQFYLAIRRRFGRQAAPKRRVRLLGNVVTLEADQAKTARLDIELRLIDEKDNRVLLSKLYRRAEPMKAKTPAAYAAAQAKALESIIDEALKDIAKALQ